MRPRFSRRLALGAAAVAVAAGSGGAYAVTQGSKDSEREALLNNAAKRLNVSPDELEKALQGAFFDRLDAAVAAGRLSKEQADAIKERVRQHGGIPFLGGPHPGGPRGFHHHGPPGIDAAADYLGLTHAQLLERRADGKSLADIAKERGKSVDGLKDAIKAGVRRDLDEAVKDKRLTDAERDRLLSRLDDHIDEIVERSGPPVFRRHRFHGPPGPPGPGRPGFDKDRDQGGGTIL